MDENEELLDVGEGEEGEEGQLEQEGTPLNKKKLLLIGGGALVLILIAVSVAYFAGLFGSSSAEAAQEPKKPKAVINQAVALEPLTVQLADQGRRLRFVRIKLTLGVSQTDEQEKSHDDNPTFLPKLQDRLVFLLGSKTSEELSRPDSREQLKEELFKEISAIYPASDGKVLELYVTELLVQ